jgi:hypothetical protein
MCCNRRKNQRVSIVAKLVNDHLINNSRAAHNEPVITSSRAAHIEPLGPPPAYEQIEKDPKDIHATEFLDNEELSPVYTSRDTNINSLSNNTTMASVRPTCQSRWSIDSRSTNIARRSVSFEPNIALRRQSCEELMAVRSAHLSKACPT